MRRLLLPFVVAVVGYSAAAWWTAERRVGGVLPWRPDANAIESDADKLRGQAARIPMSLKRATGPDIVVIVLDTVRADRLGLYGYDRDTTPRLDAWAAGARVYDRMTSDAAWTLPSHASLFTGLAPITHGAHGVPRGSADVASPLRSGTPTVARALKSAGYVTAGIAANRGFLDSVWGLAQGFDLWMCEQLVRDRQHLGYVTADRITAMAKGFLEGHREERGDAPVFLFVNYMDAHSPWIPRAGYTREPEAIDRRVLPSGARFSAIRERLLADGDLEPEVARAWSEAYDAELRFLDDHLGDLLEALPGLGIDGDDYVFILADHGEYLGEHSLVEHSKDLFEEVLRVPLIVKGPGYAAGRDPTPIQTHDVATRLLAAGALDPLAGAVQTADLQVSELYWSRMRDLKNPRYADRFDRIRRAFRIGDHKLILGSDGSDEAYDLVADPHELSPLGGPHGTGPDWADGLRARAGEWLAAQVEAPMLTPEGEVDQSALRELGYIE